MPTPRATERSGDIIVLYDSLKQIGKPPNVMWGGTVMEKG